LGKRSLAMLASVVALAILVAGCGGAGNLETLTKTEYEKVAEALCAKDRRQMSEDLQAFSSQHHLAGGKRSDAQTRELVEEVVLPGLRSEVEEIQDLPIPPGDAHHLKMMLGKLKRGLKEGEADPGGFFRANKSEFSEFSEGWIMAREYEVDQCGKPFFHVRY
jgi:hypothetical protein